MLCMYNHVTYFPQPIVFVPMYIKHYRATAVTVVIELAIPD